MIGMSLDELMGGEPVKPEPDPIFDHFLALMVATAKGDHAEIGRLLDKPPAGVVKGHYPNGDSAAVKAED